MDKKFYYKNVVEDIAEKANKTAFENWKKTLDIHMVTVIGMTTDDMPDNDYWRMWEVGISTMKIAKKVLKAINIGAYETTIGGFSFWIF